MVGLYRNGCVEDDEGNDDGRGPGESHESEGVDNPGELLKGGRLGEDDGSGVCLTEGDVRGGTDP